MHNIEYWPYKEDVDKKQVVNEIERYIERNGDYGGSGVRWCRDKICENREAAEKWINKNEHGSYDQLAIRYYKTIPFTNAKIEELDKKNNEAYKAYYDKDRANYIKTRTSEFIGCSKCKSRLASKYLNSNFCPVCRADLRPETTLKAIAAAKAKWEKIQQAKEDYVNKHAKKEVCWLVKIEYHT